MQGKQQLWNLLILRLNLNSVFTKPSLRYAYIALCPQSKLCQARMHAGEQIAFGTFIIPVRRGKCKQKFCSFLSPLPRRCKRSEIIFLPYLFAQKKSQCKIRLHRALCLLVLILYCKNILHIVRHNTYMPLKRQSVQKHFKN